MFFRPLTAALLAASSVAAWPIFFYATSDCRSEPIEVLERPPYPGECKYFREDVKSYSGGTHDKIQKVLLYHNAKTCEPDAAHRVYSNHTINNSRNACVAFKNTSEHPRAYTFIEEFLPLHPPKNASFDASCTTPLRVQS